MKQLKALHEQLLSTGNIERDALDSWAEQGKLIPSGQLVSTFDQSVKLFDKRYLSVFSIEAFVGDADQLFIDLMQFLMAADYDFDQWGEPSFDVEPVDQHAADIEFAVWFNESVYVVKDGNGNYNQVDPDIATADAIEIETNIRCQ